MEGLYAFPNWFIGLVFVVSAIALSLVLMFGLRAVLPMRDDKDTFDITIRVMPTVLSLTAIVLGFSVVQANNDVARAKKIVTEEATSIAQLDRLLIRIDDKVTLASRSALAALARSIIDDEWPHLRSGHDSFGHPTTRTRMLALNDAVRAIDVGSAKGHDLTNDAIRATEQIEDLRDARLRESDEAIPSLFWAVIGFLTLVMMCLGTFLRPTFTNVVMVAGQAAAVGMLTAFLFALDHPFMGESAIEPTMLKRVILGLSVKS